MCHAHADTHTHFWVVTHTSNMGDVLGFASETFFFFSNHLTTGWIFWDFLQWLFLRRWIFWLQQGEAEGPTHLGAWLLGNLFVPTYSDNSILVAENIWAILS